MRAKGSIVGLAVAVGIGLLGFPASTPAATYSVLSAADENDPGNSICALREAVIVANANSEGVYTECDFNESTPFGADTITITTSVTLDEAETGVDDASDGDLDVTDDLTVQGTPNLSVTQPVVQGGRIFEVPAAGDDLTLNGFELMGGSVFGLESSDTANRGGAIKFVGGAGDDLTLSNMHVHQAVLSGITGVNRGGAIHATGAGSQVTITDGTVIDNNDVGPGNPAPENSGGGIAVEGSNMTLLVDEESHIDNNGAGGGSNNVPGTGAGIFFAATGDSVLTLTDATIDGNIAGGGGDNSPGDGGGIAIPSGAAPVVTITDTAITTNQAAPGPGNSTGQGGGLFVNNENTEIVLSGVTIDQNIAGGNGGTGSGAGGGIYSRGDINVGDGSMISANDAGKTVLTTGFGDGAGIYMPGPPGSDADLAVTDSTITGNEAGTSGGVGGGIELGGDGNLNITDSVVSDNTSAGFSGGIQRLDAEAGAEPVDTITRSTISENTAGGGVPGGAGGITLESSGTMTIDSSTITDNRAIGVPADMMFTFGGGIVATSALNGSSGTLVLRNSTVSDNRATSVLNGGEGGGLFTDHAVDHAEINVEIDHTTFAENEADPEGAGGRGGNLLVQGTTSGLVTIRGSIITAGLGDAGDQNCNLPTDLIASDGGSVEGPAIGPFAAPPTDQCELDGPADVSADPLLGPLLLNAPGTTMTHALAAGSPAIDRAGGCPPPALDQRGVSRPQGGACDSGAYERVPPAPDTAPPSTTITERPKNRIKTKKKRVRITYEFISSEPGQGGFQCQIDVEEFVLCTSPFSIKVRRGKHTFRVRAYDALANADQSLETDDFKVVKKKPKR